MQSAYHNHMQKCNGAHDKQYVSVVLMMSLMSIVSLLMLCHLLPSYFIRELTVPTVPPWRMLLLANSSPNASTPFRRVFMDSTKLYNPTGGPEAQIQLALAFHSFLPNHTFFAPIAIEKSDLNHFKTVKRSNHLVQKSYYNDLEPFATRFQIDYPKCMSIPVLSRSDLTAGDVLILPECIPCPEDLIARGVEVYIWILASNRDMMKKLTASKCNALSHNYWLSHSLGIDIPTTSVLRPYVTPNLIPQAPTSRLLKENLILIDDDTPSKVINSIYQICRELKCTAIIIKGFTRAQLPPMYDRAKVVIDWCMRGSERMPIEAVLRGAILISSACECVQDKRDFPIPGRNIIPHTAVYFSALRSTLQRVLQKYDEEYLAYADMRELYGRHISAQSLDLETHDWFMEHYSQEK
jgi:hypothetical protein